MSRLITGGATSYGEATTVPTALNAETSTMTLMAWFRPSSIENGTVFSIGKSTGTGYLALGMQGEGKVFLESGTGSDSLSTGKLTISTWGHIAATLESKASLSYLNGTAGTASTTSTNTALNRINVGCLTLAGSRLSFTHGEIAHVAAWSIKLTATQIKELAEGKNPYNVERANLVAYWPLEGKESPEKSFKNEFGEALTLGVSAEIGTTNPTVESAESEHKTVEGKSSLSGTSALTAKGTKQTSTKAVLSGTSALTAKGVRQAATKVSLSATSGITVKGSRIATTKVALSATSSMLVGGKRIAVGKISLSAASSLSAKGVRISTGTINLGASSTITVTGLQRTRLGKSSQTAVSSQTIVGQRIPTTRVVLSATSQLKATGFKIVSGKANLEATAILHASAEGNHQVIGAAHLSATATLNVKGIRLAFTNAPLSASAALTARGLRISSGRASLAAQSALHVSGVRISTGRSALTATSALQASGIRIATGKTALQAVSAIHAAGFAIREGRIALSATSVMHLDGRVIRSGAVTLTANSVLHVSGKPTRLAVVRLEAHGILTADGHIDEIFERHADESVTLTINDAYRATATHVTNSFYVIESEDPHYIIWEKDESTLGLDLYPGRITLGIDDTEEVKQSGGIEVTFSEYDDLVKASI